ncbi:MAG: type IV secretory system conjugative DNA transfer family protein [Oribacterium sp.]|nr:type IV secretory system conjugative DNA transfer family protein [Oribacterium sp.]
MKKKIFLLIVGTAGFAFFLTLGIIVAPYIKNGGLLLMLIKPYKPYLQFEWCNGISVKCMLFFTVVYAFTVLLIWLRGRAVRAGEEYGSMRWLTAKELGRKYSAGGKESDTKDSSRGRIITKNIKLNEDTQALGRNLNMIVEGGPGTCKTRGVVIPNVMQVALSGGSAFVIDPKGEILADTGSLLRDSGVRTLVLDLKNLKKSFNYNPFKYIHCTEDAIKVVDMIWQSTLGKDKSEGNDPFWPGAARAGLLAYVLYLWEFGLPTEKNFEMVIYMFDNDEPQAKGELSPVGKLFARLKEKNPDHPALFWYDIMHSGTSDMQHSVRAVFSERLKYFSLPAVLELTRTDDLDLPSMATEPTVLFCITPITNNSFNFLVSLLFMQMIDELYLLADREYNSKLPRHFHFLIDEFYKFRVLEENFIDFLSTNRGYNISCTMIIQAYQQLEANYKKEGSQVIEGCCDSYLFLGSNSISSTEHIAKLLGNETINTTTYGYSFGGHGNRSSNYQQAKRELLDANELRVLDNGKAVYFIRGEYPVLDDKYDMKQHPYYKLLGESTGNFYDHGEVRNKMLLEKGKENSKDGKKIDVTVSGGQGFRYYTEEEVNSFLG